MIEDVGQLAFYRYATVEENKQANIPIALWRISEADEKRLDRYEGVPVYYIRKTAQVTLNTGKTAEGLIYIMEKHRNEPVPDDYYTFTHTEEEIEDSHISTNPRKDTAN